MNGEVITLSDDDMTSIGIPFWLKVKLDKLKVHPREPYYQVVDRYLPLEAPENGCESKL